MVRPRLGARRHRPGVIVSRDISVLSRLALRVETVSPWLSVGNDLSRELLRPKRDAGRLRACERIRCSDRRRRADQPSKLAAPRRTARRGIGQPFRCSRRLSCPPDGSWLPARRQDPRCMLGLVSSLRLLAGVAYASTSSMCTRPRRVRPGPATSACGGLPNSSRPGHYLTPISVALTCRETQGRQG